MQRSSELGEQASLCYTATRSDGRLTAELRLRFRRGRIAARVYWPRERDWGRAPLVVFLPDHDDPDSGRRADVICRSLCAAGATVVLALLAPDAHPAKELALEDDVIALGWVGFNPPEGLVVTVGQIATLYYFVHFVILFPLLGKLERPGPLPLSIGTAVLQGGGAQLGRAGAPMANP